MMSVASDAAARLRDRPDAHDSTRLLVVDDHAAVRVGLTQLLEDQLDFEVVAAVAGQKPPCRSPNASAPTWRSSITNLASATACG
jgi:CheY-like chemotaxis protein